MLSCKVSAKQSIVMQSDCIVTHCKHCNGDAKLSIAKCLHGEAKQCNVPAKHCTANQSACKIEQPSQLAGLFYLVDANNFLDFV